MLGTCHAAFINVHVGDGVGVAVAAEYNADLQGRAEPPSHVHHSTKNKNIRTCVRALFENSSTNVRRLFENCAGSVR